jgi:hypothetical protein
MSESTSQRWFYGADGGRKGPVNREALVDLLLSGELPESTLVWYAGLPNWRPAHEIPDLRREFPPPLPVRPAEGSPDGQPLETPDEGTPSEDGPEASEETSSDEDRASGEGMPAGDAPSESGEHIFEAAEIRARAKRRKRNRLRHHRGRAEDRFVVVPRDQKKLLLWAWPLLVLAGIIVWLLLLRANRVPDERPILLQPISSLTNHLDGHGDLALGGTKSRHL